jgi:hypothetical protein
MTKCCIDLHFCPKSLYCTARIAICYCTLCQKIVGAVQWKYGFCVTWLNVVLQLAAKIERSTRYNLIELWHADILINLHLICSQMHSCNLSNTFPRLQGKSRSIPLLNHSKTRYNILEKTQFQNHCDQLRPNTTFCQKFGLLLLNIC